MPETRSFGLWLRMSSLSTLTWIGLRPDWSAQREGEQYLKT